MTKECVRAGTPYRGFAGTGSVRLGKSDRALPYFAGNAAEFRRFAIRHDAAGWAVIVCSVDTDTADVAPYSGRGE